MEFYDFTDRIANMFGRSSKFDFSATEMQQLNDVYSSIQYEGYNLRDSETNYYTKDFSTSESAVCNANKLDGFLGYVED